MTLVKIIGQLKSNHYNRTDGMSDKLRYGIINNHKKENILLSLIVIEQ